MTTHTLKQCGKRHAYCNICNPKVVECLKALGVEPWNKGLTKETDERVSRGNKNRSILLKRRWDSGEMSFIDWIRIQEGNTKRLKDLSSCSSRTKAKIIERADISCMVCGWREASRDIAHIVSIKDGGTWDLDNLIILCPNHHRMFDRGKMEGGFWIGKTVKDLERNVKD